LSDVSLDRSIICLRYLVEVTLIKVCT